MGLINASLVNIFLDMVVNLVVIMNVLAVQLLVLVYITMEPVKVASCGMNIVYIVIKVDARNAKVATVLALVECIVGKVTDDILCYFLCFDIWGAYAPPVFIFKHN